MLSFLHGLASRGSCLLPGDTFPGILGETSKRSDCHGHCISRGHRRDEAAIRRLFVEMLRTIFHTQEVEGYPAGYVGRFFTGGEDEILVAEQAGMVVGFLSLESHREGEPPFLYLDDFSVAAACRGQGIGSPPAGHGGGVRRRVGAGGNPPPRGAGQPRRPPPVPAPGLWRAGGAGRPAAAGEEALILLGEAHGHAVDLHAALGPG